MLLDNHAQILEVASRVAIIKVRPILITHFFEISKTYCVSSISRIVFDVQLQKKAMIIATCGLAVLVTVVATACIYILLNRPIATSLKSSALEPARILLITNPEDIMPPDALELRQHKINTSAKLSDAQNVSLGVAAQSWEGNTRLDNPIRLVRGNFEDLTGDTTRDPPHILFGVYDEFYCTD